MKPVPYFQVRLTARIQGFIWAVIVCLLIAPALAGEPSDTRIVINVPSRTLWLYSGDTIVRSYPVGVGKPNFPTPEGHFRVIRKVPNPGWENPFQAAGKNRIKPGRNNPLGTRWIGFLRNSIGEFGIHGTNAPETVGTFSSHGCVRMLIQDAEELYDSISQGTPLEVNYDNVVIEGNGSEVKISVYPNLFGKKGLSLGQVRERILKRHPSAQVNETLLAQVLNDSTAKPPLAERSLQKTIGSNHSVTFKLRVTN